MKEKLNNGQKFIVDTARKYAALNTGAEQLDFITNIKPSTNTQEENLAITALVQTLVKMGENEPEKLNDYRAVLNKFAQTADRLKHSADMMGAMEFTPAYAVPTKSIVEMVLSFAYFYATADTPKEKANVKRKAFHFCKNVPDGDGERSFEKMFDGVTWKSVDYWLDHENDLVKIAKSSLPSWKWVEVIAL